MVVVVVVVVLVAVVVVSLGTSDGFGLVQVFEPLANSQWMLS